MTAGWPGGPLARGVAGAGKEGRAGQGQGGGLGSRAGQQSLDTIFGGSSFNTFMLQLVQSVRQSFTPKLGNKPAAQAAGADPSR